MSLNGQRKFKPEELVAIAEELGTSVDYLLGTTSDPRPFVEFVMGEPGNVVPAQTIGPQTEAAEDLDQIMKDLAAENPDIVIRFRNMRKSWPEMSREEKRIVLDGMMYVLGRADADVESRLRREGGLDKS